MDNRPDLYERTKELRQAIYDLKTLFSAWNDAVYWAYNYDLTTKDIRERKYKEALEIEEHMRLVFLNMVKGQGGVI